MRDFPQSLGCASASGFTLIELLIVLVVLAILASIAIPGYRAHIDRAKRTDATGALLRVQAAQEKFFLQHPTAAPPAGLGMPGVSPQTFYLLQLEVDDADAAMSFTVIATPNPTGGPARDSRCQRFTLDHTGSRHAFGADGADRTAECWR
jgi:type IV pilus assembly protein PilE